MWSLRNKVLLGTLLGVTLIIIGSVVIFYKKDAEMIQNEYAQNLYQRAVQTGKYIDNMMLNVYEISIELTYDEELRTLLEQYQSKGEITNLVQVLIDYKNKNSEISSICIYLAGRGAIITSEEYPVYMTGVTVDAEMESAGNPRLMQLPYKKEGDVLSFVNSLPWAGMMDIYVMVNIQERTLYYNYLDTLDGENVQNMILLDINQEVVSAKDRSLIGISSGNEMGVSYQMPFSQYTIQVVVSIDDLLAQMRSLRVFVLSLSVIFLVVAFFIFYFSTNLIYKPLNQLTETVKEVAKGDLDRRYIVKTRDEVGMLGTNLNNMLDQINNLFSQLIEEERLKKDAELDALQYQITPHFMYNTLNTIKCYALLKEQQEIADLIACFVELLQAAISKKGSYITLDCELDIVSRYIKLQKFRSGDVFKAHYNVSEDAAKCYVPRLILQPFVENTIMHGFNRRDAGNEIQIVSNVGDDYLVIEITDNGVGMTQETIDKLLNRPAKKLTGMSSIGIANVKERLRLYFGEKAKITMVSLERGVAITIVMPVIRKSEEEE